MNQASLKSVTQRMSIGCKALNVDCIIGVYPHERNTLQKLVVDCNASLQLNVVHWQDALESTVSYVLLIEVITKTLQEGAFHLLETAALAIAKNILALDIRIIDVSLYIKKRLAGQNVFAHVSLHMERS